MDEQARNIRFLVQYDGTRYQGWQRQKTGEGTIQAKLESVLSRICEEPINVIGASRTDSGVHAEAQVANFHTRSRLAIEGMAERCHRYLPEDIVVVGADEVPERFHSRYLARSKRYAYRICNRRFHDVFRRRYRYHVPEPLEVTSMRRAAALLTGTHDFASFCSSRRGDKSTLRELTRAEIEERDGLVEILFEAPTFLYEMARILAGTLIEVGLGRISAASIPGILERRERRAAGFTAPPRGLCLLAVRYDPPFDRLAPARG